MNGSYDVQRDGYTQKPASIREEIAGSDAPAAKAPEQTEYLPPEAAGVPSLPELGDVRRAGGVRWAASAVA
jgi:hypothetical protein